MATKAELMAELEMLRAKMAEPDPDVAPDTSVPEEPGAMEGSADTASAGAAPDGFADARTELERILAPHGVSIAEIEALADQLWEELETLPQKKPLVTAIAAFALGFVLGRMSK